MLNGDGPDLNAERLWQSCLKIGLGHGACVVVAGVTPRHGSWESHVQGEGKQIFHIVRVREQHTVLDPTVLLTILGPMATEPEVKFDTLFPKLYNTDLW